MEAELVDGVAGIVASAAVSVAAVAIIAAVEAGLVAAVAASSLVYLELCLEHQPL